MDIIDKELVGTKFTETEKLIVKIGDFGVKVYLKSTPKKSVDYLASQWKSITKKKTKLKQS